MEKKEEKNKVKDIYHIIFLILLLILIVLVGILIYRLKSNTKINNEEDTKPIYNGEALEKLSIDPKATDEDLKNAQEFLETQTINFPGYDDFVANKESVMNLINPKENGVFYIKYILKVDNNIIYETDLIPSGEHIDIKPATYLNKGTYTLNIVEEPYYEVKPNNFLALTSATNQINITIIE